MAITILQRVDLYLLRLVCCISLLNVSVNSIIFFKLLYFSITVFLVFLTGLSAVIVALTPGAQFLLPDSMEEWVYSVLVTLKKNINKLCQKKGDEVILSWEKESCASVLTGWIFKCCYFPFYKYY